RAVVGGVVVAILLARTGFGTVRDAIAHADLAEVLLAFGLLLVGLLVNALRWHVFLRSLALHASVTATIRLTFVGTFFNAFLPTGVGGDAYRTAALGPKAGSISSPLATVFLDRLAGLVGLAALGLAGSVASSAGRTSLRTAILLAGLGVLVASALALA